MQYRTPKGLVSREQLIEECQAALNYVFVNQTLLIAALTHASSADSRIVSNERLEFLGDAVLGIVICDHIFRMYPERLEGDLTKIKSVVVSRRACARIAKILNLDKFLILGRGMATQASLPVSVVSAALESLIAAIYLDGGLDEARKFILTNAQEEIDRAAGDYHGENHKSILQQLSQRDFGAIPVYEMVDESGPDHSKSFKVSAVIGDRKFRPAWGRNKKEAQQRAALNALNQIHGLEIPFPGE